LDRPVPHPTTLVKLVRRAGPKVIDELNAALLAKLATGKLLRARKLRVDTTVVEADIAYPTDADLLAHAVRKLGGLVRRVKARGRPAGRDSGIGDGRPGEAAGPHAAAAHRGGDGRGGPANRRGRGDRQAVAAGRARGARNARRTLTRRPGDGRLGRLVGELEETIAATP
jgi:transposase, IS5 family